MNSIGSYLKGDIALCNQLYYKTCQHIQDQAHVLAALAMQQFAQALERHMQIEERILFTAFEATRGYCDSPTDTLRNEHMQIRDTMQRMWLALEAHHARTFLLHADTLRLVLREHANKENFKLFPLVEQVLEQRQKELFDAIKKFNCHDERTLAHAVQA